jgi:SAM-dependent methyltransferase
MGELDDLTQRLAVDSASLFEHNDIDSASLVEHDDSGYNLQLLRDNAERLLLTLKVAAPFLTSSHPSVLECGAGALYTVSALQWRYGDRLSVHAVEHPRAIREGLEAEVARRRVEFAPCDLIADELPWPERQFDLIVLAEVIEHLPPTELPFVLQRIAARLSPGGGLVMSSPNPAAISNIFSLAFGHAMMLQLPLPSQTGTFGHIRMYSRGEVEQLLGFAGLRLAEWKLTNWHHDDPWPGAPVRDRIRLGVQRTVPWLITRWSSGWVCSAVKAT